MNLESKLKELEIIDAPQRDQLLESPAYQIENTVYPTYRSLIEFLTYQQNIATTDDVFWKLPDGADFYTYTLRNHTTAN